MGKKVASKETIDLLINNSKQAIIDSENLLHNIELIKSKIGNKDSINNYLQLLFELLSGSLSGMYEVYSGLKSMLSTNSVYAKRYHMQMINLSQYEWCTYLCGKDKEGVLSKLKNRLNEQHYNTQELNEIMQQVYSLGKKCNVGLRTMTAHYDKPDIMYKKLAVLNDEDIYAKRVSDQLLIHDMILKYVSPVLQAITETLCINAIEITNKKWGKEFSIQGFLNDKIAEAFIKKGELDNITSEQLANAWNDIESIKRTYDTCEKAIAFLKPKQIDNSRLVEIKSIAEMRLAVTFMRYDLECSMNSYLNASSNIERSICFMRVYRLETGALTHLYGYNEERKQDSIWCKLKLIPEFKSSPLSNDIENKLKALTLHLDCTKRNLYTHYREGQHLNISDRWRCANEMDHPKELMQMLQLITLCKNINQYLHSLLSLIDSTVKKKNDEMLEPIRKIKELANRNNLPDIVKMSDKLLSIFSCPDRKS